MLDHQGESDWKAGRGLHRFAILVAFLTVVLLVAGALVTSNEAGDSVPDWPLSFGRWLIDSDYFVANVRYEYSHRFIAGVVGFATFLLALLAWRGERRGWVRRLAYITLAGVFAQALIGGVRVIFFEHKPLIAIPHALIAQSFFAAIIAIAVFTSRGWWERTEVRPDGGGPPLRTLTVVTVAAVLLQLVLGAGFRHGAFTVLPHAAGRNHRGIAHHLDRAGHDAPSPGRLLFSATGAARARARHRAICAGRSGVLVAACGRLLSACRRRRFSKLDDGSLSDFDRAGAAGRADDFAHGRARSRRGAYARNHDGAHAQVLSRARFGGRARTGPPTAHGRRDSGKGGGLVLCNRHTL